MLVGLNCSKFFIKNKQKDSYFTVSDENSKLGKFFNNLRFSYKLDTQDFLIFNKNLFVLHHQACKKSNLMNRGNVEFYDLNNINSITPKKLENNNELNYPTCLTSNENLIAIGIGGKEFKSKIFIYNKFLSLVKIINLDYGLNSPPSGLLFDGGNLIASFYKSNSIIVFNVENNFEIKSNINNLNLKNPLSLSSFNKKVYISSHIGSKLIELDLANNQLNYINSKLIQNPWGLFIMNNKLIIINMNLEKKTLSTLVSLDLNNKLKAFKTDIDKNGLITAKNINC